MPRLRKTRASSFEISSSSTGTSRGRNSRIVTSLPKLRKIDANSTPTAPAPITISDLGGALRLRISMLVRMASSAFNPGSSLASDPVASIIFLALVWVFVPLESTSTVCTPSFGTRDQTTIRDTASELWNSIPSRTLFYVLEPGEL